MNIENINNNDINNIKIEDKIDNQVELKSHIKEKQSEKMSLIDFIAHFDFVSLSVAMALGISFNYFVKNLTAELLYPLFGILLHVKHIQDYKINVKGTELNIGKVMSAFMGYIILMLFIIFFGYYVFGNFLTDLRNRKTKTSREILKHQEETSEYLKSLVDIESHMVSGFRI